jgi:hypothetical protein
MSPTHTGRRAHRFGDVVHFDEVTLKAHPTSGESTVTVADPAVAALREVFGDDVDHHLRYGVTAGILAQIGMANVAGEMPEMGRTSLAVEVVAVRISGNAGRDNSCSLLAIASMDAVGNYLQAYELGRVG